MCEYFGRMPRALNLNPTSVLYSLFARIPQIKIQWFHFIYHYDFVSSNCIYEYQWRQKWKWFESECSPSNSIRLTFIVFKQFDYDTNRWRERNKKGQKFTFPFFPDTKKKWIILFTAVFWWSIRKMTTVNVLCSNTWALYDIWKTRTVVLFIGNLDSSLTSHLRITHIIRTYILGLFTVHLPSRLLHVNQNGKWNYYLDNVLQRSALWWFSNGKSAPLVFCCYHSKFQQNDFIFNEIVNFRLTIPIPACCVCCRKQTVFIILVISSDDHCSSSSFHYTYFLLLLNANAIEPCASRWMSETLGKVKE